MSNDLEPPAIASRADFGAALHWGFGAAIAAGARRIVISDPTFVDWPLDDGALLQQLAAWLRLPRRRLLLLAASYDDVPRLHPRFNAWRATWSHAIECRTPADSDVADLRTLLVDDGRVSVLLIDPLRWRGRADHDAQTAQQLRDRCDALLQRSEAAFAVKPLGL